jgi:hypothetical protein
LFFKGEAVLIDSKPILNGLGSLECKAYSDENQKVHFSTFNGIFVENVRQGYTSMVVTDEVGQMLWKFEGVYKNNEPNG